MSKIQKENSKQQNVSVPVLFSLWIIAILFRWATSVWPYSGQAKPPMFGDYEAQRHWMEITYSLPLREWYFNTSDNDLQYWGLDYPPLTAYHSWILGAVSSKINASWVDLRTSRGHESYSHKLFMRYSVLVADLLVYLPAVFVYVLKFQKRESDFKLQCYYLAQWLLYPGLILIDYGHFQYNNVSLGFMLWAVIAMVARRDLIGSIMFVMALSYKQMELYHALPFFAYLFGSCLQLPFAKGCWKLIQLATVVIFSFAVVWFPFLVDPSILLQVLHRLFPFARGIFEDKVANVWCALSVVIKWKKYFNSDQLVLMCALSTLGGLIPAAFITIRRPTKRNLKLFLIISALVFFLFSFQVHEKSILLAAIPALLNMHESPFANSWFLLNTVFSLYPLCVKDEIQIPFFAWILFYYFWTCDFLLTTGALPKRQEKLRRLKLYAFHISYWVGFSLCVVSAFLEPPGPYPDLWPLLNSVHCCVHFCGFLLFYYWQLVRETDFFNSKRRKEKTH